MLEAFTVDLIHFWYLWLFSLKNDGWILGGQPAVTRTAVRIPALNLIWKRRKKKKKVNAKRHFRKQYL